MKAMKKVLALGLALAMVVTAVPVTSAEAASAKLPAKKTYYVGKTNTLKLNATKVKKTVWSKSGAAVTLSAKAKKSVKVTAVKAGSATVKAKVTYTTGKTQTYKCAVTVKKPVITVPKTATVVEGETVSVKATAKKPSSATVKYSTADETIATVDAKTGEVTGVKAGTVKITATLTCGTKKVTAKTDVTVESALSAEQTAKNQITVKGADSDKVADYTVKRGNISVSLKSAEVKDNTVVLTSMTKSLATGDYTLTYGDNTVSFKVEEAKITSIALVRDNLIKNDNTYTAGTSKAKFSFRTLDQFGNDINVTNVNCTTAYGTDAVATTGSAKEVEVTVGTATIGTTTPVVLVDTASGVTLNATLTVSAARAATKAEFVGVYDKSKTNELTAVTLTKGDNAGTKNAALLFALTDQYGDAVTTAGSDITFPASNGTTGLTVGTASSVKIADKDYIALALTGVAASGTINVNVIQNVTGVIGTATVSVGEGTIVKSFTVSVSETLYAKKATKLEFVALDQDGKEITDATVLNSLITGSDNDSKSATFTANKDGSVSLDYTPDSKGTKVLVFTLNAGTVNAATQTLTVNVEDVRVPNAIIGLDKDVATVVTANNSSVATIKCQDLIVEDQFGNVLTDDEVEASGYTFKTAVDATNGATVTAITDAIAKTTEVAKTTAATKEGKTVVTVTLYKADGTTAVDKSDYDITLEIVDINKVTDFAFAEVGLVEQGKVAVGGVKVTGKYNGATVELAATEYTQISGSGKLTDGALTAPAISGDETKTETDTIKAVINNKAADEITLTYQYSNAAKKTVKIESKADTVTATATDKIVVTDLDKTIKVTDQYGNVTDPVSAGATRYNIKSVKTATGADAGTIAYNKTVKTEVTGLTANTAYTVSIEYIVGDVTFTQDVVVTTAAS